MVVYGPQQGLASTTVQSSPNPDVGPRVDDRAIEPDLRHCMMHMFGHGRQKENIILVPYMHSFFVCAFIHILHGRLYYVSILLLLLLLYYYYYYLLLLRVSA